MKSLTSEEIDTLHASLLLLDSKEEFDKYAQYRESKEKREADPEQVKAAYAAQIQTFIAMGAEVIDHIILT